MSTDRNVKFSTMETKAMVFQLTEDLRTEIIIVNQIIGEFH
jgi:hypothetical protein